MSGKRAGLFAGVLLCLFVLCPTALFSQAVATGTIVGTVTDPSGAAVAGATVTLTDPSTTGSRTATTNEAGRYIFVNIPPGSYDLAISKTGFNVTKFNQQQVTVGSTLTLDASLVLGTSTEIVEVTASNAELQTMNATVGNTISGIALDSLPSISRDASTFVTLQPGVSPDGSVAGHGPELLRARRWSEHQRHGRQHEHLHPQLCW